MGSSKKKFKKLNSEIGDDDDQLLAERIGTSDFCSLSLVFIDTAEKWENRLVKKKKSAHTNQFERPFSDIYFI